MKKTALKVLLVGGFAFASALFVRNGFSYDKMLKKPPAKFCGMCHSDKLKHFDKSGHGKFSVTCQQCHDPHGEGNEKMLKKPAAEFCFMCHSDKKAHYQSSGHGKVQVSCQMCHDPHGTPSEGEDEKPAAPAKKQK